MATPALAEVDVRRPSEDFVTAKRPRIEIGELEGPQLAILELSRGAEGLVTRIPYLGRIAVRKERFPKKYRHPELDAKLTSRRLAQEARVLLRLRKAGIRVPAVYRIDARDNVLIMEYLPGITLKSFLQEGGANGDRGKQIMSDAGREVARMHKCEVVHGDLTTGNIMVLSEDLARVENTSTERDAICIIDFGLSSGGGTDEDKAVDLYVLERAVISAHSETAEPLNEAFLEAYGAEIRKPSVLRRLAEVRSRGRKRDMTG